MKTNRLTCRRGICTAAASTDSAAKAGPLEASRASSRASLSPAAVRLALYAGNVSFGQI